MGGNGLKKSESRLLYEREGRRKKFKRGKKGRKGECSITFYLFEFKQRLVQQGKGGTLLLFSFGSSGGGGERGERPVTVPNSELPGRGSTWRTGPKARDVGVKKERAQKWMGGGDLGNREL